MVELREAFATDAVAIGIIFLMATIAGVYVMRITK